MYEPKKRLRQQGIILQREKLLCLWVPAHRQTKTLSKYGTEWKKWSKTAFVYKNLKSVSRSKCTNYELPTYRDEYFLRRLKLQSYPEAVRFLLLLMRFLFFNKTSESNCQLIPRGLTLIESHCYEVPIMIKPNWACEIVNLLSRNSGTIDFSFYITLAISFR